MSIDIPLRTEVTILPGDDPDIQLNPVEFRFNERVGCSLYRPPVFEGEKPSKVRHELSAGETLLLPSLLGGGHIPLVVGPDLMTATAPNGSVADLRKDDKGWMCTCLRTQRRTEEPVSE